MSLRSQTVVRYALAAGAIGAGYLLREALTAWVGPGLPTYITFYPAVMVAALLGGFGPGLLAAVLTTLVADYLILEPVGIFSVASQRDLVGLILFLLMGVFISTLAHLYSRARAKAVAYDGEMALQEARREKEYLSDLLEQAAQPFAMGYPDGRLGRLNRAYEELTGYSAAELRTLDWSATLTPPEWHELEKQKLDQLNTTRQPVRYEKEYIRKDGSRVPVELLVHLKCDAFGNPEYYYSFVTDLTERRQTEQAVRASEERFRSAMDNMLEGCQIIGRDWRYAYINDTAERHNRRPKADLIGKRYVDMWPGIESTHIFAVIRRCMEDGTAETFENKFTFPDGTIGWFDLSIQPVPEGIFILTMDITERKRTEEEVAKQAALINLSPDAIISRTPEGSITFWSEGATTLYGWTKGEAVGKSSHDLLRTRFPVPLDKINEQLRDTAHWSGELVHTTRAGKQIDVESRWSIHQRETGEEFLLESNIDITERKRTEEALRQATKEWALTFDGVPDLIAIIDKEYRVVRANRAMAERMGLTPDRCVGIRCFEAAHGLRCAPESCPHRLTLKDGLTHTSEVHEEKLGGDFLVSTTPLLDKQGQFIGSVHVARDITERKNAEEAMRDIAVQKQAVQYTRSLIEVSLDPLVTISAEGKITDVNEAAIKATGVPRQELIGTDFSNYFTQPEEAEQGYRRVFAQGSVTDYPLTIRHRNGQLIDVLYNATLYKDPHGNVQGVFAAARDITAQKQASQYARSLLEASPDPLVTISSDGKITDVNEATVRAIGRSREELIGSDFSSYFVESEKAEQGYKQVFATGFVIDYPLTLRHRNGSLTDVLYNATLYKDNHGNVQGVFAAARDVTVQKRAEAELRRHKDNLEVLVRERTAELETLNAELARSNENLQQFAYASSHDLQEPLRIMSSFSQLLEKRYKNRLDTDADEFIGYIVGAAARMQNLITDLLAYSRAGHKDAEKTSVDCTAVVQRIVQSMAATIGSAGANVAIDTLPTIMAHEASIIQLFQNLISNGLKFHGKAAPRVHISAKKVETDWVFSVCDNGIGIEQEYFQRIFLIFQRLHTRDEYAGTGMGLSICKKIVDNLGGRIWVESEVGKGSTFSFTIPT